VLLNEMCVSDEQQHGVGGNVLLAVLAACLANVALIATDQARAIQA
jgi:hypothetical protein